jgi:hypothetical protein
MFRSTLAVRANWQKNCQQQDASNERELRPKSFTRNSDSVSAHLSLPFRTLLFTVLRLYGAIMHAAIYDAVNAIDKTHKRYLVRLTGVSHFAPEDAAAHAAAHAVRVSLSPKFQTALDAQLQLLLATIPEGADKAEGIRIGQAVADRILALRSSDGSTDTPPPFNFGSAAGDYQSTPPNFPKQPQFTNWPRATPFALECANQFRPGAPPAPTSDASAMFSPKCNHWESQVAPQRLQARC